MRMLVLREGTRRYALPVGDVDETTRVLPTELVAGAPKFLRGVAIIRGQPVPVVDLGRLLGGSQGEPSRFVTLRLGHRRVALAVDQVIGVRDLDDSAVATPPLLKDVHPSTVAGLDRLDGQLMVVLRAGRLVPDEVWPLIESQKDSR